MPLCRQILPTYGCNPDSGSLKLDHFKDNSNWGLCEQVSILPVRSISLPMHSHRVSLSSVAWVISTLPKSPTGLGAFTPPIYIHILLKIVSTPGSLYELNFWWGRPSSKSKREGVNNNNNNKSLNWTRSDAPIDCTLGMHILSSILFKNLKMPVILFSSQVCVTRRFYTNNAYLVCKS